MKLPETTVCDLEIALPKYKCHKVVHAAKIFRVDEKVINLVGAPAVSVPAGWIVKHKPEAGGYFVLYAGGYSSYSPKEAFEDGYSRVEPGPCTSAPEGWRCTREKDHEGPCAAVQVMKPTIGRIVIYTLPCGIDGSMAALPGQKCPMMVTSLDDEGRPNGFIFLDCGYTFAHSIEQGSEPGQWDWPARAFA